MTLRCLFVDFDSFFASVEQHDNPALRGRPVAVVPVESLSTCCIAASKEAKRDYGIKTGTGVAEAIQRCPDIAIVLARPARYIDMHHAFMAAIEDCIHLEPASSVDEVHAWLMGRERQRDNAIAIARAIKRKLVEVGIGPSMTCSIGIGPNRFIAKTASDMEKPDGLTVIERDALPGALLGLQPRDLCGIGPSMEARLQRAGIDDMRKLCALPREAMRALWGGIEGERFWLQLHGFELPERQTQRASIGHSHVLGPTLRDVEGMRSVLFKLLAKAAMRLRHEGFRAGALHVAVRFVGMGVRYERSHRFAPIDDTPGLLHLLGAMLAPLQRAARLDRWNPRRHPPLAVAVTLGELEAVGSRSGELMPERERAHALSRALDRINHKYRLDAVHVAAAGRAVADGAAPMRIPFQHVPDRRIEDDAGFTGTSELDACAPGMLLYKQAEDRFKVLAEKTHRERRQQHSPSGAGGWHRGMATSTASPQARLF